jgi:hypothetical protein
MAEPTEKQLEQQVTEALALESSLAEMESQLAPELREFLVRQKETTQQISTFWKNIEKQMIDSDIKSIKGDWGSITIAERIGWDISPLLELPAKFYKKVPDLKRMTDYFRLEGKPPKGAAPKYTKYLTKRIKGRGDNNA